MQRKGECGGEARGDAFLVFHHTKTKKHAAAVSGKDLRTERTPAKRKMLLPLDLVGRIAGSQCVVC